MPPARGRSPSTVSHARSRGRLPPNFRLTTLVAATTTWTSIINERKRTQPIVIAHEAHGRQFSSQLGYWAIGGYVTSEGGGPAFNVRFGVEFHGIRYPYKLRVEDPDSGNVQRVVRPGERRPDAGHWLILVDSTRLWGVVAEGGDPDPSRLYWARYENAQGQVWETRNPGNRSTKLSIRRVRFVRLVEGREERRRVEAGKRAVEWERNALAELRAEMGKSQAEDRNGAHVEWFD